MAKWQYKDRAFQVKRKWEKDLWIAMQESADHLQAYCRASLKEGTVTSPSEEGEKPHSVTGELRSSIHAQAKRSGDNMTVTLYSTAPYARRLELGFSGTITYTSSSGKKVKYTIKTGARPFIRPAIEENKRDILKLIGRKARF